MRPSAKILGIQACLGVTCLRVIRINDHRTMARRIRHMIDHVGTALVFHRNDQDLPYGKASQKDVKTCEIKSH